jgi:Xaa-Pro aminopeptidase
MDRREFLGSLTAAAGAAAISSTAHAAPAASGNSESAGSGPTIRVDTSNNHNGLGKTIPINKDRAYAVMEELGIDGLVALRPHNVYYITNTVPTLVAFGAEYPALATFPRDPSQPSFLISSLGNSWETSNGDRDVPQVITFTGAKNWQDYINATPEKMRQEPESNGVERSKPAVKQGAKLTKREQGWLNASQTYGLASAATQEWALVHALKQSGLLRGRIAVDDMRIAYLLQRIGIDSVTIIPGDNIFRKIRHIKTDNEVELMRVAQKATQEAAMAAAHALEEGMVYDDFRQRFFAEASARGTDPAFILFGVTQGLLPDGVVKRGQSYMIDCSSHYKMYHADFARTVNVGEPSAEAMRYFKAQQIGREEAFAIIKEGVPFHKVEQVARDAMLKAGMPSDFQLPIGMHSVGLEHGDDPARMDVPFGAPESHVLAANMVVTLDLPYHQIGWGCGHNEDLLRITKTGYEILNDPKEPLIVV